MKERGLLATSLVCFFALLTTVSPTQPTKRSKKSPICIIGAGASGLSAGIRLQQKGYKNILILEKNPHPGGKAFTLIGPDLLLYPMGAVFTVDSDFLSLELLDEYGVETYSDSLDGVYFDPNSGVTIAQPPTNTTLIAPAVQKYGRLRRSYEYYLVPGYINGVPPELLKSSLDWILDNELGALWEGIVSYVTLFGYGSLTKLPAIYMLLSLDEMALASAYNASLRLITDWGQLWNRVSWNFNIRYEVDITDVQRRNGTGKAITITYTMAVKGQTYRRKQYTARCRYLIAAIPSTLDTLTTFNLDSTENSIFSQARHINYYTALVNMPNSNLSNFLGYIRPKNTSQVPIQPLGTKPPPPPGYIFVEPPGDGKPMLYTFFGYFADSQYTTYYAWKEGDPISLHQLEQIGLKSLSLLNHPVGQQPGSYPLTKEDFVKSFWWYYFPYFNNDTITPTIFAELEALQGYRNTFWLSSLRCFEIMEDVIASAYDIVDSFF